MPKPNICCIFNYAPHYRAPIYELMDKELNCDFYFGDTVGTEIKEMDVNKLKGFKNKLIRKKISRWNYFWLVGMSKKLFKDYDYYIISGGSKYLSYWILLLFCKFNSKKVYSWGHGIKGNKSKIQTFIDILFYKLCDKVLLYGNYSKNIMISNGFKKDKLEIIYNSLEYDFHLSNRKKGCKTTIYKDYFKNDFPVIIYIGRIQKSKKLNMIIDVAQQLNEQGEIVNLVFVGKDLENNTLKSEVKSRKLENHTWFFGPCYDENKISELMFNAKVCVSPGPIGLTAIHAASYGLPIITNNDFKNQMPEFEIITEGINGDFFEKDNYESLFEKIYFWINANHSIINKAKICSYNHIDNFYNPYYQLKLLKRLTHTK